MADTEKITINLSVVDFGRIDLLVDQGFYTTRTDFIRTAIRNQLETHKDEIAGTIKRRAIVLGVLSYGRNDLERKREKREMIDIRVAGMLILEKDITPELAHATINSIGIYGVFKAPDAVKQALSERMV